MPIYITENTFYKTFNTEVLNEAYFGTSKELQRIIDTLGEFRNRYSKVKGFTYNNRTSVMAQDPVLMSFNKQMEDFFGFYIFNLLIDMSASFNGWTISAPIRSTRKLTRNDIVQTKNGIAYKKEAQVRCVVTIYSGLIFDMNFTDREVMAIILHEIGHNFSYFMSTSIYLDTSIGRIEKWLLWVYTVIDLINGRGMDPELPGLLMLNTSDETYDMYMKIRKEIYKNPVTSIVADMYNTGLSAYRDISSKIAEYKFIYRFITVPGYKINAILYRLIMALFSLPWRKFGLDYISKYKNEKIADSFPTMYGLGPDMQSCFQKIDYIGHKKDSIEGKVLEYTPVGILYDIEMLPYIACCTLLDEHPDDNARLVNQYKYIEAELKKSDLDPRMKKDLERQLVESQENINKARKIQANGRIVSQFYNLLMIDIFGGDVRELISRIGDPDKDKYNRRMDNLLTQIDKK